MFGFTKHSVCAFLFLIQCSELVKSGLVWFSIWCFVWIFYLTSDRRAVRERFGESSISESQPLQVVVCISKCGVIGVDLLSETVVADKFAHTLDV